MPEEPIVATPTEPAATPAAPDTSKMTMAERVSLAFPKSLGGQGLNLSEPSPDPSPGPTSPEPPTPAAPVEPAASITSPQVTIAPTPTEPGIIPDSAFEPTPPPAADADLVGKQYDAPENIKKDAKQYENWNVVRRDLEKQERIAQRAEARASELQKQVENYKTDEGLKARNTELETRVADLSKRQEVWDLQHTDAFQNQFIQPRQAAVARAMEIAKENSIDPADIEKAFALGTPAARKEALNEVLRGIDSSPADANELGAIIARVNQIDKDVTGALSDAGGNLKRLREHEAAEQSRYLEGYNKSVLDSVDKISDWLYKEKKLPFFNPDIPDESFKKVQLEAKAEAKRILTQSTNLSEHAAAVTLGTMTEPIYNWGLNNLKRLQAALKEIAELKGADPTLNGKTRTESTTTRPDKGLSFAEAVSRSSGLP